MTRIYPRQSSSPAAPRAHVISKCMCHRRGVAVAPGFVSGGLCMIAHALAGACRLTGLHASMLGSLPLAAHRTRSGDVTPASGYLDAADASMALRGYAARRELALGTCGYKSDSDTFPASQTTVDQRYSVLVTLRQIDDVRTWTNRRLHIVPSPGYAPTCS